MATRIPLPGNGGDALQRGVETGSNMFQQLLGQGVNLGRMHQQGQQFDKQMGFNEKQLAQQWQQHLNNLALHQQQEKRLQETARLAANLQPWQIENLKATIGYHEAQTKDLQRKQSMFEQLMNTGGMGDGQMVDQGDMQPAEPFSMGEGMTPGFNAFGGQDMQQAAPPPMEAVKKGFSGLTGPQAAFVKSQLGYDAFAETPQQEQARKLNEFKEKERIKLENKQNIDRTKPTQAIITQNQNIVAAVNNLIPQIEKIKKLETPNLLTGKFTDANTYSTYKTETDKAADSLMSAFKWLGIEASLDMAKDMTKRMPRESDKNYHARLDSLLEEMLERQKNAYNIYKGGEVKPLQKMEKPNKKEKVSPLEASNKAEGKEEPVYNLATGEWE